MTRPDRPDGGDDRDESALSCPPLSSSADDLSCGDLLGMTPRRFPQQISAGATSTYDVVVIGGGAAGLGGALALGRARRSVLVLDAGQPRNAPAAHAHNYLGREGAPPLELLADARAEVARYGVEVRSASVVAAHVTDAGFRIELAAGGSVTGRRLLIATGLLDELPTDVEGLAERWGRDVLHCPYCHGWEVRDQVLAVLATGPGAVEQALLFRQWSRDVILLVHTADDPTDEQYEKLAARDISLVEGKVTAVQVDDDRLVGVRLDSGRVVHADAVVILPTFTTRAAPFAGLDVRPVPWPTESSTGTAVKVGPGGATAVPGVWAAGNAADLYAGVLQAAAAGVTAGAAINADLVVEDTSRAVAERRASALPSAERFWEEHHLQATGRNGPPRMNPVVAGVVANVEPARALDLGCGEGGDTLGLAALGWQVTAVDVSSTVLDRVRDRARAAELAHRITVEQHDLTRTLPDGTYDLVSAAYLHSPVDLDRAAVLRKVAGNIAPGGLLLLVDHGSTAPWSWNQDPEARFVTPAALFAELDLPAHQWRAERLDTPLREASGPDGELATVTDTVVAVRRR